MRLLSFANLAIGVLLTVQCGLATAQSAATPKPSPASSAQELERRVRLLELQVKGLQNRVAYRSATLDCNSGKYDEFLFETGALVFFAACTKIEPYLEGHRITISIGNPHSFSFSNVKGSLSYGKDWGDAIGKKVDVSITETIRGASWNTVSVIVNPSKAEDMRFLSLELNTETASPMR